ncbi:fungal-specific transcription factor domain-containing protein [Pseudomassariella vexata]|uniref:Fungal-specific transcription factor domain-domain-containing protein n=1 Tax=Pseudomassariella vexata TaxID=1141098 RepID=A0A1Y2E1C5_9PEZI|nr:fungal-specific transcription factor domain-containing protein [Pseudomassariella vexata]ORY65330.1 fungal-specific transcription factor domain-domain-containing protein [Pseudomassariella vexata]
MSVTSRRVLGALLACDFCRHRKRRCDGQRPCSTCRDSNADCVYKELPYDRIEDASPTAVVDRLARIEALLEQQSQQLHHLSSSSTPTSLQTARSDYFSTPSFSQQQGYLGPLATVPLEFPSDSMQFLIPKGHTTLASTLLSVPKVRDLLGEYPRDFFHNVEERLPLPGVLNDLHQTPVSWPTLRPAALGTLIQSYFRNAHPHHPLFTPSAFKTWQTKLNDKTAAEDIETAMSLCVCALGAISSHPAEEEKNDEVPGQDFFNPALRIILHHYNWSFKPNLRVCQALILASSYFAHLGRPLHSWRMGFYACQKFLHYMEVRRRQSDFVEYSDAELRVFWLCFMVECNRAAELDTPRSGIEPMGDKMPLPHRLDPSDEEDTINFVAETAIRRLLNRIHSSLYSPENSDMSSSAATPSDSAVKWQGLSLQKLLSLSSELNRQLEQWYTSIPDGMRPPRETEPIATDRGRVLRIRYYAARHIIHRPFVLHAVVQQQQVPQAAGSPSATPQDLCTGLPQVVIEKCEICIDSCVTYLYNAVEMLDKRTLYLWSFSQSCMACLIVLMMAQGCAPLRQFVPPMKPLQNMVLNKLRKWAVKGSSIEAEVVILEHLVFDDSHSS